MTSSGGTLTSSGNNTLNCTGGTCISYTGTSSSGFLQQTGGSLTINGPGSGILLQCGPSTNSNVAVIYTTGGTLNLQNSGGTVGSTSANYCVRFNGSLLTANAGSNGCAFSSNGTTGAYYGVRVLAGSATITGALIATNQDYALGVTGGTVTYSGNPSSSVAGITTNLTAPVIYLSSGVLNWTGSSSVAANTDAVVSVTGGTLNLATASAALSLSDSGNFVLQHGAGTIVTTNGANTAALTLATSSAMATLLGMGVSPTYSNFIIGPTLPTTAQVASGVTYGYASALLTGGASVCIGTPPTVNQIVSTYSGTFSIGATTYTPSSSGWSVGNLDTSGSNVLNGVTFGPMTAGTPAYTGNYVQPVQSTVLTTGSYGPSGGISGTWSAPAQANIYGNYGVGNGSTGTFTIPPANYVLTTAGSYGIGGTGTAPGLYDPVGSVHVVNGNTAWIQGIVGTIPAASGVLTGAGTYSVASGTATITHYTPTLTLPTGDYVWGGGTLSTYGVAGQSITPTLTLPTGSNVLTVAGSYGLGGNGSLGTYNVSNLSITGSDVLSGITWGPGSIYTGTITAGSGSGSILSLTASNVLNGVTYSTDTSGGTAAGTYSVTQLSPSNVLSPIQWGPGLIYTGTATGGSVLSLAQSNVLYNVPFSTNTSGGSAAGTFWVPNVAAGTSPSATPDAKAVRHGLSFGPGGSLTGTAPVPGPLYTTPPPLGHSTEPVPSIPAATRNKVIRIGPDGAVIILEEAK